MELTKPAQTSVNVAALQNLECNECVHKNVCGYASVYVNIRSQIDDSIKQIVGDVPIFSVSISCKEFTRPVATPKNMQMDPSVMAHTGMGVSPQTLYNPLSSANVR